MCSLANSVKLPVWIPNNSGQYSLLTAADTLTVYGI
jgi:hypothetical protein